VALSFVVHGLNLLKQLILHTRELTGVSDYWMPGKASFCALVYAAGAPRSHKF
jgi:hypothetical protein